MEQFALEFDSVSKRFGVNTVLSEINLQTRPGEYLGLVGVNGAGKTTLIKCLLDFVGLTSGAIKIFGVPSTETNARKKLTFLPEKFIPPYYLTGEDFLKYSLELHKVPYIPEEALNVLAVLDFERTALHKPVRQYSKGMSQKIGLASCLLSGKDLHILDEPMSGLDPKARANLKHYLLELKEQGTSLFFSSHQLADVNIMCDRILILHGGRICFDGAPEKCCETYESTDLEQAYLRCIETSESNKAA